MRTSWNYRDTPQSIRGSTPVCISVIYLKKKKSEKEEKRKKSEGERRIRNNKKRKHVSFEYEFLLRRREWCVPSRTVLVSLVRTSVCRDNSWRTMGERGVVRSAPESISMFFGEAMRICCVWKEIKKKRNTRRKRNVRKLVQKKEKYDTEERWKKFEHGVEIIMQ